MASLFPPADTEKSVSIVGAGLVLTDMYFVLLYFLKIAFKGMGLEFSSGCILPLNFTGQALAGPASIGFGFIETHMAHRFIRMLIGY